MRYILTILMITVLLIISACSSLTSHTTSQLTTQAPTTVETSANTTTEPSNTLPSPTTPVQELTVHFIDVGQGDSILIDSGQTEILINGGDRSPGVVIYLSDYVDGAIEVIVVAHPHADHIGGLIAVPEQYDVEQVWYNGDESTSKTYQDFMNAVEYEETEVHIARLYDVLQAGDLSFKVHNPADLEGSTNNNSIVLHLAYGQVDFLFMGDAEQEAEETMMILDSLPVPEVEVLKVGHHGSRTASSEQFLSITSPEVAIYIAGEGNTYGHPHEETIIALTNIGALIYGTDVNGTIVVTTDGETYQVEPER